MSNKLNLRIPEVDVVKDTAHARDTTPEYVLRYSKKAKHLQMRISTRGLEIIIPEKKRLANHIIEEFIQIKRRWIDKNLAYIDKKQKDLSLPTLINLQAINQQWQVNYLPTQVNRIKLIENADRQLTLIGDIDQEAVCRQKLRKWLSEKAKTTLHQELINLSVETGLFFNRLTIRNNITRWGSCSVKKDISLCSKLLFLPPILMRHVLIHELCHTKVMHHGKSFWRLLEQFDLSAREHSRRLNSSIELIPNWAQ